MVLGGGKRKGEKAARVRDGRTGTVPIDLKITVPIDSIKFLSTGTVLRRKAARQSNKIVKIFCL